jgi:hypothetical protein
VTKSQEEMKLVVAQVIMTVTSLLPVSIGEGAVKGAMAVEGREWGPEGVMDVTTFAVGSPWWGNHPSEPAVR